MSHENDLFSWLNLGGLIIGLIFLLLHCVKALINARDTKINTKKKRLIFWCIFIFLIIDIPLSVNNYYRITNNYIYDSPYFTLDEKKYRWQSDVKKIVYRITGGENDRKRGGVKYEIHFKDGKSIELNVNVHRAVHGNISLANLRKIDAIAQSNYIPFEYDSYMSDYKVDELKDTQMKDFITELLSR